MRVNRLLLPLFLLLLSWMVSGCPACTGPLEDQDGGEDGGDAGPEGGDGGDGGIPQDAGSLTLNAPLWQSYPRLSPDGTRIAFIYSQGGTGPRQLAVVGLDGTGLRVLVPDAGTTLASPAWGADGSTIYWTGADGIEGIPAAGGAAQELYSYPFNAFVNPDVSRAGDVMVWGVSGLSPMRHLDFQSGVVRPFSANGSRIRLSPDEKSVAFTLDTNVWVAAVDGGSGVYAFGSTPTLMLDGGTLAVAAEWLPSGTELAVATDRGLEVLPVAAPSQRTLVLPKQNVSALEVSRDGALWLYGVNGEWPLYFFRPDGG